MLKLELFIFYREVSVKRADIAKNNSGSSKKANVNYNKIISVAKDIEKCHCFMVGYLRNDPGRWKKCKMNKNCVIIGVGPGNGASFARRFSNAGYKVAMLSRNQLFLSKLSSEIENSKAVPCDARDPESISIAISRVHEEIGPVDVMIYNAGAGDWKSLEETKPEEFESSWKTNTYGLLIATQQVIATMKVRGQGSIVVIGATASLRGGAQTAGFASAKAAQRSLAQSMARSLGPKGIHVSYVVIDGVINLETSRATMVGRPDEFFLQPDAIAETVYNLTQQQRSAWSFEIDLRPHIEKW